MLTYGYDSLDGVRHGTTRYLLIAMAGAAGTTALAGLLVGAIASVWAMTTCVVIAVVTALIQYWISFTDNQLRRYILLVASCALLSAVAGVCVLWHNGPAVVLVLASTLSLGMLGMPLGGRLLLLRWSAPRAFCQFSRGLARWRGRQR